MVAGMARARFFRSLRPNQPQLIKKMLPNNIQNLTRAATLAVALSLGIAGTTHAQEYVPTLPDSPIRLSSNENHFGFSPKAIEAMKEALDNGSFYNRNNVNDLEALLAEMEGVPEDYIITTPGSGPILIMTALAYAEKGKNVVTTEMGYTQLVRRFAAKGGDVKFAPLGEDMGYDLDALRAEIDGDTAIVYICNPNNPTGVMIDPNELRQFIMTVPQDILVFIDEAYLELSSGTLKSNTMIPLTKIRKNLIVCRTFSKGYGMAGHRIGFGAAHPDVLSKLQMYSYGGLSYLSAIGAIEALKDSEYFQSNIDNYKTIRAYTAAKLDAMGIEYADPQGAFIYFKAGVPNALVREAMLAAGVAVTTSRESGVEPGTFDLWTRVSIGKKEHMDQFLEVLAKLIGKEFEATDLSI